MVTIGASIILPAIAVAVLGFAVTASAAVTSPTTRSPHASTSSGRVKPLPPSTSTAHPVSLIVVPRADDGLAVYAAPGATAPDQVIPPVNELGSPLVLLAVARAGDWYQVLLPTRPNGSMAWARAADVTVTDPVNRVEVSRAAHVLQVVRNVDGVVLLTSIAGVGSPLTPTPTGEFFVRDLFPTGTMDHPYGPFAFGLSGHSDALQTFGTGDGRIAIHGTNQPATIGADASNGCVHVPNDVDLDLVALLPLGTPVTIS